MSITQITNNGNWQYKVSLQPVALLPGQHSLEVSSQWLDAKDPNGQVRQLQITLPLSDVQELHRDLGAYLAVQS